MTASDRPFVTSRDPKGSHTLRLCAEAYDEAQFPDDRAQRLNDRGGEFKERLAALFAELSNTDEFSDEECASEYQYPADFAVRPIREQVDALAALFPGLSLGGTMEYLEKLPPVPGSCDGYYAVPKLEVVARLVCPDEKDPAKQYCRLVEYVFEKLAASRSFTNWRDGEIDTDHLRQHSRTVEMLAKLAESQPGDILIIPGQLGILHRGKSVRRARVVFSANEFGFGTFAVGCILLTNPSRLGTGDELWIDLSGDEWSFEADGQFGEAPIFSFSDRLEFGSYDVSRANARCGSASGFVPQFDRAS
jgi:hypothetical protein